MTRTEKGIKMITGMLGNAAKQIASQVLLDNMKTLVATAQTNAKSPQVPATPADIPDLVKQANEAK